MSFQMLSLALAASCTGFLVLYFLATRLRRYLRLRHIPGPVAASLTNLWLLVKMRYGSYRDEAINLDRKYGAVQRYGPNRVLFSQVEAIPSIYGTTNVMEKADNYDVPVPVINGKLTPSFASIRDEKKVSAIRRHVQHAFSTTGILDYEDHIDETIQVLVANLRDSGSPVNLHQWLSFFTFDTMCRLAFSDDPGMMNRQQDVGDTMKGGQDRFMYWNDWFVIPKIEGILYKNRFVKNIVPQSILTKMAIERVQDRLRKGGAGTHQDLMDRYFQAREKSPALFDIPTISSITLSTIHAGSETTGHTLTYVFWNLLKNPQVYDRLKKECREADLSSPPKFAEVKKMPFVEACVKESQRLYQLIIVPIERVVPADGATICGTFIPGGTVVASNTHALSLDPEIYGPNVHMYNPDRWLTCTNPQRSTMERASMALAMASGSVWAFIWPGIELADPNFQIETEKRMAAFAKELLVIIKQRDVD